MSFHESVDRCPGCETKLSEAHPVLAAWFRDVVKAQFPDAHISWAFRDEQSQNLALKEGRSRLSWPLSKHNVTQDGKPCSHALDLFRLDLTGHALFPMSWYREIAARSEEDGSPIRWGGTFISFPDLDHFQLEESMLQSQDADPQSPAIPSPAPEKE